MGDNANPKRWYLLLRLPGIEVPAVDSATASRLVVVDQIERESKFLVRFDRACVLRTGCCGFFECEINLGKRRCTN